MEKETYLVEATAHEQASHSKGNHGKVGTTNTSSAIGEWQQARAWSVGGRWHRAGWTTSATAEAWVTNGAARAIGDRVWGGDNERNTGGDWMSSG